MANVIEVTESDKIYTGTSGADSIVSGDGIAPSNVTVNAGDGDDTIEDFYYSSQINGENGNDFIRIYGGSNTINGGKGNDTIYDNYYTQLAIEYADGDGDDVIFLYYYNEYFDKERPIYITSGSVSKVFGKGTDLVLNIGEGSMTFKKAENKIINVKDSTGDNYYYFDGANAVKALYVDNSDFTATDGNDFIYSNGNSTAETINSGAGNDTIYNNASVLIVNGGSGNDSILGGSSTVIGGIGDDTIDVNFVSVVQYSNGDGSDVITNYYGSKIQVTDGIVNEIKGNGDDVILTISSGSIKLNDSKNKVVHYQDITGDNYFLFDGDHTVNVLNVEGKEFEGTTDDDYIYVTYKSVSGGRFTNIDAGAGNDTIVNSYEWSSINGGSGNDYIYFHSSGTVVGGIGDDTIDSYSHWSIIQYADGDGNDIIINDDYYKNTLTIQLTSGVVNGFTGNGKDAVLHIGSGSITLKNFTNRTFDIQNVDGSLDHYLYNGKEVISLSDAIFHYEFDSTNKVTGTSGDDLIVNMAYTETITSGNGKDTIYALREGDGVKLISAGDDDDLIVNYHYCSVNGGAGDDIINSYDMIYGTIKAGLGNDTINFLEDSGYPGDSSYSRITQYENGDGNDIVFGYEFFDTIQITDDSTYSTVESGNDIIINIGDGSMTLKDAKGTELNISGGTYENIGGDDDGGETGGSDDDTVKPDDGEDTTPPNPHDLIKVILTDATISPYTATSKVGTIDGSSYTQRWSWR